MKRCFRIWAAVLCFFIAAPAIAQDTMTMVRASLPRDLSPWGMFQTANDVVQAVMIGLVLASVITWTVGMAKAVELLALKRRLRGALTTLDGARSSVEAQRSLGEKSPAAELVRAAIAEEALSADGSAEGLKERVASRLERIEAAAGRRMSRGTGILATIGATAPFIGLFGTVWGIMDSFVGISRAQTISPSSPQASRRRCWLPPSGWSLPFQRLSFTTCSHELLPAAARRLGMPRLR